jgi:hypothetical protein
MAGRLLVFKVKSTAIKLKNSGLNLNWMSLTMASYNPVSYRGQANFSEEHLWN